MRNICPLTHPVPVFESLSLFWIFFCLYLTNKMGHRCKDRILSQLCVCVECLIGKQNKPILFKVTEPSSIPYRTHSACAKMAAYPDPPPVIPLPESIAAQAAYQLRYKNTEYCSWVSSGPKCFQVLGLSPSLL